MVLGAWCSIVGWGTVLQAWRLQVQFPTRFSGFVNRPNPSSRTMALVSTQPLAEMSTRHLLGLKASWHVRLTTSPSSMSGFFRKWWSLDVSQSCGPLWPGYRGSFLCIKIILHGHRYDHVYVMPFVNSSACITVTDPSCLSIYWSIVYLRRGRESKEVNSIKSQRLSEGDRLTTVVM
jgi:hypothetical protein